MLLKYILPAMVIAMVLLSPLAMAGNGNGNNGNGNGNGGGDGNDPGHGHGHGGRPTPGLEVGILTGLGASGYIGLQILKARHKTSLRSPENK